MLAVGLMSGTSLDGVDAALVEIDGVDESTNFKLLKFITVPFTSDVKNRIKTTLDIETSNVELISSLNFELGEIFGEAVTKVCSEYGIESGTLAFVASHGQTIYHLPESNDKNIFRSTLQIGEPAIIAEKTKTTVVANFRPRDMAVGGQGAPIVPYAEFIQFRSPTKLRLLQNIGGIGNITVIPKNARLEQLTAFDTGPGNMVIDELCRFFFKQEYDAAGKIAAAGTVDEFVLTALMQNEYFSRPIPKTTGRELFGQQYVKNILNKFTLSPTDWVATATALTAKSIAISVEPFLSKSDVEAELIIAGGGSYNPTLIALIKKYLPQVTVLTQEDLGLSSEAKEAVAMVVLGNQALQHRPSNVPSATGAAKNVILGSVTYYD